ncbi:MAG: apolipoprotein N-acyltransferase [Desulfovibrionaceae bacterium]
MTRHSLFWGIAGTAGFFAGFPNPFWHIPPAVLLYPVALCVLGLCASRAVAAFRAGWLVGLAGASAALYWIAVPLHNVGQIPWFLAIPCAMALGAYVGLFAGFFSTAAYLLRKHSPFIRALELGLIWYFLEVLRGCLFTGFPWLSLSTAFVPWPVLLQGASVTGAYALAGIFVTLACWLALPAAAGNSRNLRIAGALLFVLLWAGGAWRLEQHPLVSATDPDVRPVLFVEGNIDQNQKWDPVWQKATVNTYMALTAQALPTWGNKTPLVIWPETAMPFYYQEHPLYGPQLRNFVADHNITLVLGAPGYRKNGATKTFHIFNRAYLLSPEGRDAGSYEKEHLVPFGEYLPPLLAFDFLKPLLQGVGDFTTGSSTAPLNTGDLSLGMLICYESIFPELAQERVNEGANILLNISNDGWFGDTSAAQQHLELAAVRSIEQGRWLLRGTNTGISAVFDHVGRLVVRGGQFTPQTVPAYAQLRSQTTVYHRLAPFIPWIGLALFIALFILEHFRRRVYLKGNYDTIC